MFRYTFAICIAMKVDLIFTLSHATSKWSFSSVIEQMAWNENCNSLVDWLKSKNEINPQTVTVLMMGLASFSVMSVSFCF